MINDHFGTDYSLETPSAAMFREPEAEAERLRMARVLSAGADGPLSPRAGGKKKKGGGGGGGILGKLLAGGELGGARQSSKKKKKKKGGKGEVKPEGRSKSKSRRKRLRERERRGWGLHLRTRWRDGRRRPTALQLLMGEAKPPLPESSGGSGSAGSDGSSSSSGGSESSGRLVGGVLCGGPVLQPRGCLAAGAGAWCITFYPIACV
jgi:hypothetical protein